ncbi:hypothetical protein RJ640_003488 [Escallonia rubra]|uniref:DUF4228 domain protein n=1 Tax=Escallonia rubra TaxID=112253 RepID=A0AA88R7J5_9ASTE|nr:hypothetical protein RJ640_003486 [Escallonia rubra]KAK2979749.1 hypothetical protein RJ640_003488 [Escallonia rubra]
MGGCFSCRSPATFINTRVVHLNGFVEDYEGPVTVSQVTGKPPKHFVCTQAQLLSTGLKPLKPDTQLEAGKIYFLLPYSAFRAEVSPMDLASMARKLTNKAKSARLDAKSVRTRLLASPNGSSPAWCSPARSPADRFLDRSIEDETGQDVAAYGMQKSTKSRSWRPILATIKERSFNRRSESDLKEKPSEQRDSSLNMR